MGLFSWFRAKKKKSYVTAKKKLPGRKKKEIHKITYRQEMVSDGKSNKKYGPYWYGYYRKKGKLHKFYIGKKLHKRGEIG